jgi:predicted nucleotidyltransferase
MSTMTSKRTKSLIFNLCKWYNKKRKAVFAMANDVQKELEVIKESVLSVVPNTEAIYLFGSYAYGLPNDESDLDIYVVVPNKSMCDNEIYSQIIMGLYKKVSTPVDVLLRDEEHFYERINLPTLERKIYNEGVKVYG